MTPKEKAKDLYHTYRGIVSQDCVSINDTNEYYLMVDNETIKELAIAAADEIITYLTQFKKRPYLDMSTINYWYEVKQEIEKL